MKRAPRPGDETDANDALLCVYDAWNRLVAVHDDNDGDGVIDAGELLAVYQYDGLHRRIVKLLPDGEDYKRTDYYYNEGWQVLEERYEAAGSATTAATDVRTQYAWDPRYIDAPAVRWHDLNDDQDFADSNEVLFYCNDANMNVTALVNTSGSVVERYMYDPYGKPTVLSNRNRMRPTGSSAPMGLRLPSGTMGSISAATRRAPT